MSDTLGQGHSTAGNLDAGIDARNSHDTVTEGHGCTQSKRSDVYAMLMNDKSTNYESGTRFGLGVRHKF